MKCNKLGRWLPAICLLAGLFVLGGCERNEQPDEASAVSAEQDDDQQRRSQTPASDDGHDAHEDVHLGETMYELGRRFSAIWFAGNAANKEMVDYQIHEIEELVEELEPASPTENGVDVVARLKADVLAPLEDVEKAVEADDKEAFGAAYRTVMNNCTACHQNTGHGFIRPKLPDYNPYPNLDMTPAE